MSLTFENEVRLNLELYLGDGSWNRIGLWVESWNLQKDEIAQGVAQNSTGIA